MGRRKESKNKTSNTQPVIAALSPKERIRLLANLVIDRIRVDQKNGKLLYKKIRKM